MALENTCAGYWQCLVLARGHYPKKRVSRTAFQSNSGDYSGRTHLAHPLQPDSAHRGEELTRADGVGSTVLSGGTGVGGMEVPGTLLR